MRILIIGSGGREHALAAKLSESPRVSGIFVAPGNGGTTSVAANINIPATHINALVDFARQKSIDLVIPGPEAPLVLGITDAMRNAGIPCFGPDAWCAQLEGSKSFAKEIMARAGVPTAPHETFSDAESAQAHILNKGAPLVIKADGLAQGKGVIVAETTEEALAALDELAKLGEAAKKIIIEEKLTGEEVSLLCLCSGLDALPLPSAQDHKAAYDGDKGPNTGGMGAYSPAPVLPDNQLEKMTDLVIRPILAELAKAGHPFTGILYAGLMITDKGPKVLEYNVRFGDPECQAILPRLRSDLASHLLACVSGNLAREKPEYAKDACLGVVLAAPGYPGKYPKGLPISGLEEMEENIKIFHSGTAQGANGLESSGGRVLCVTALGQTLASARDNAYAAVARIRMPNGHYRKDIGAKGLAHL